MFSEMWKMTMHTLCVMHLLMDRSTRNTSIPPNYYHLDRSEYAMYVYNDTARRWDDNCMFGNQSRWTCRLWAKESSFSSGLCSITHAFLTQCVPCNGYSREAKQSLLPESMYNNCSYSSLTGRSEPLRCPDLSEVDLPLNSFKQSRSQSTIQSSAYSVSQRTESEVDAL